VLLLVLFGEQNFFYNVAFQKFAEYVKEKFEPKGECIRHSTVQFMKTARDSRHGVNNQRNAGSEK
jgi:hypothetical protein